MIAIILILILVALILRKSVVKPKGYPPGPQWLPWFGSSLLVDRLTLKYNSNWKAFSQIAKDYKTEVLGLKLGHEPVVVIYGEKLIRQSLMMKEFDGRPDTYFVDLRCFGKRAGVTFTDGPFWKEQRQFMVEQLLDVGFGKTDLQMQIQQENLAIVERVKGFQQKPVKIRSLVASPYMNILWKYVAGDKIPDDRIKGLLEMFYDRQKAFSMAGGWLNAFPWLRFIFPVMSGYKFIVDINKQVKQVIDQAIKDHKERKVEGNDFIYTFLQEMDQNKPNYTEDQLRVLCLDFVIASACTMNMMEYIFLAVLRHPEHQEKIYEEIKTHVGDRVPCWNDSFRLTYTQAFLLEVQRFYNVAPMLGPRRTLKDTEIGGYQIPQETTVMMSVGDLYFDADKWKNPRVFDPSRFIDGKGELRTELTEHFFTFGKGRRRCPGDSLAKSFVFINFTGLMKKFRVSPANGRIPSDETEIGLLSQPKAYKAVFTPRD